MNDDNAGDKKGGGDPKPRKVRSTMMHVDSVKSGEDSAWERLTAKVIDETKRHARQNRLPPTWEADDIAQLVCVSAFQSIADFEGSHPDSFRRWVRTIIKNRTTDLWRAARATKREGEQDAVPLEDDESNSIDIEDPAGFTPLAMLEAKEGEERLEYAEAGLSKRHRQVLRMREQDGRSYEDIARELNLEKGTDAARLLFHYARKRRANRMREYIDSRPER